MKILLTAPTSDKKDYCLEEWVNCIKQYEVDTFIVDNSKDKYHYKKLCEKGLNAVHYPINGKPIEWLTECQNLIRDYFLAGDWDYLFMLESDVITDPNFLNRAIANIKSKNADVFTGTYYIEKNGEATLCLHYNYVDLEGKTKGKVLPSEYTNNLIGSGIVQVHRSKKDLYLYGSGIGNTVFTRKALKEVEFRVNPNLSKSAFSDSYYYIDAMRKNLKVLIDLNNISKHLKYAH